MQLVSPTRRDILGGWGRRIAAVLGGIALVACVVALSTGGGGSNSLREGEFVELESLFLSDGDARRQMNDYYDQMEEKSSSQKAAARTVVHARKAKALEGVASTKKRAMATSSLRKEEYKASKGNSALVARQQALVKAPVAHHLELGKTVDKSVVDAMVKKALLRGMEEGAQQEKREERKNAANRSAQLAEAMKAKEEDARAEKERREEEEEMEEAEVSRIDARLKAQRSEEKAEKAQPSLAAAASAGADSSSPEEAEESKRIGRLELEVAHLKQRLAKEDAAGKATPAVAPVVDSPVSDAPVVDAPFADATAPAPEAAVGHRMQAVDIAHQPVEEGSSGDLSEDRDDAGEMDENQPIAFGGTPASDDSFGQRKQKAVPASDMSLERRKPDDVDDTFVVKGKPVAAEMQGGDGGVPVEAVAPDDVAQQQQKQQGQPDLIRRAVEANSPRAYPQNQQAPDAPPDNGRSQVDSEEAQAARIEDKQQQVMSDYPRSAKAVSSGPLAASSKASSSLFDEAVEQERLKRQQDEVLRRRLGMAPTVSTASPTLAAGAGDSASPSEDTADDSASPTDTVDAVNAGGDAMGVSSVGSGGMEPGGDGGLVNTQFRQQQAPALGAGSLPALKGLDRWAARQGAVQGDAMPPLHALKSWASGAGGLQKGELGALHAGESQGGLKEEAAEVSRLLKEAEGIKNGVGRDEGRMERTEARTRSDGRAIKMAEGSDTSPQP